MADDPKSMLPEPTTEAITWNGQKLTPKLIIEAWERNGPNGLMKPFHDEVKRAEGIRRGTLVRKISASWANKNPEAAAAAPAKLPQRRTLEQDLKARIGVVEPTIVCTATGDLERDETNARDRQDYLNEWKTSPNGTPYREYYTKGVEDGGFLRTRLPAFLALEGRPDFFERLSERAHDKLSEDEQQAYKHDPAVSKRRPYVKVGDNGQPMPSPKWDRDAKGRTRKEAGDGFKRHDKRSSEAHDKAVQRYLLREDASVSQVYGGLDVAPIFKRGVGRDQNELAAAVTRQLVTVEEALEAGYGWRNMGSRQLIPTGDDENNIVGMEGCYCLYTMYLTSRDKDGHVHPLIAYTLAGYGTTYGEGGAEPDDEDAVGLIDLYTTMGIESPKWSWHWGLQTGDRSPAYRGRPYISDLADLLLAIESEEMANRATIQVSSFTGHVEELADALSGPHGEQVLASVYDSKEAALKASRIPAPGEIISSIGKIRPFQQSQIGEDARWQLQSDRQALAEATAVDQAASSPGSSGHAIVVGETLAKVAKRDIRESSADATRRDVEDLEDILVAIERCYKIRWPIKKAEEPPAGETASAERYTIAEFNPEWRDEDDGAARLKAEYPAESNIAELDLEASLAERGFSHFENVMKKKGISDPVKEYEKILKWRLLFSPAAQAKAEMALATKRGDKTLIDILKQLQAEGSMTKAGVPGAQNGVPEAALRRMGEKGPQQQGRPSAAASQRGGIQAGEMATASLQQDATAQMQVGAGAA